ncbi:helix-turn-helix transcriptional regulator [Yoonia litorea]|uniref:Transcriptional regulator, LuxR family n=1 Tax=Yoonia litorea TaxID=1123755 RepID=A0A1I6LVY3_9RHOB|nr:autoinducer binding domain-containing protein [Yoonia litorea]SFS07560.1 transcriptional regulator, LuxR family [Yoonia litorea]
MSDLLGLDEIGQLAPAGYYIALRIGFAFPMEEVNELPDDWVRHYTVNGFGLFDPVLRWAYANVGTCRWSDLKIDDPRNIMSQAQSFGLRYGLVVSVFDSGANAQRSFASFARSDREFTELESKLLLAYLRRRHHEAAPPTNLTKAELEALGMVKDGLRLKEIAYRLNVSEGAVKQRLKNAKKKLGAKTGSQAAALANQFGLI